MCLKSQDTINKRLNILSLKKGETGIITDFGNPVIASKLLTMGILPNSKIQFVRKSPFGGAVYLRLNGFQLALRTNEAKAVFIKKEADDE